MNTWSGDGRWRRDGLTIIPVPGLHDRFMILPNDERQEILQACPRTGQPLDSVMLARAVADAVYPLNRVSPALWNRGRELWNSRTVPSRGSFIAKLNPADRAAVKTYLANQEGWQ